MALTYDPKPIDTSRVTLPPGLNDLAERLAENTHDVWAQQRLSDGWRYGPERNDARKEHPGLVPYAQLPDSEKIYDLTTALEIIKLLISLGFTFHPPREEPAVPGTYAARATSPENSVLASASDQASADDSIRANSVPANLALDPLRELLRSTPAPSFSDLLGHWNARDPNLWRESPDSYSLLADRFLQMGEPLLAYDIIGEGLQTFSTNARLRQLHALALARSGATGAANQELRKLQEEGHSDEETVSLLARTHKDLAAASSNEEQRRTHLLRAQQLYEQSYQLSKGYWSGINSATVAVLLGDQARATSLAREVRQSCIEILKHLEQENGDLYWPLATIGEAAIILGELSEAEDFYSRATQFAGKSFGRLQSSRRNARLLVDALHGDWARIDRCLHVPCVILFAGHMIDQPGRAIRRFPPQLEPAVRDSLRKRLQGLGAGFGFASVACGSDILFLETLLELGGEVRVVLPYEKNQFILDCVACAAGGNWGERCEAILKRADSITVSSDHRLTGGSAEFQYANLLLHGLAAVFARQLDTKLIPMAVWDGKPGDGPGGTAWNVDNWRRAELPVELIHLDQLLEENFPAMAEQGSPQFHNPPSSPAPPREFAPEICGLLFADAVGFSKLTENEVQLFVRTFLGLVGELADKSPHPPLVKNTWGDGLHFVFRNAHDAGVFALEMCEAICCSDWKGKGIRDLNVRIGLHAGPVYACVDPVTHRSGYIGTHLSRAARIEPITPPGHVFASQAFAALAAVENVQEFCCDYVGRVAQAKNYGTFPTYVVHRI